MTKAITFDYPLRSDYVAQLVLPRDLSAEEAEKLCAFVQLMAYPKPAPREPLQVTVARNELEGLRLRAAMAGGAT
jgi:hypothetical protein